MIKHSTKFNLKRKKMSTFGNDEIQWNFLTWQEDMGVLALIAVSQFIIRLTIPGLLTINLNLRYIFKDIGIYIFTRKGMYSMFTAALFKMATKCGELQNDGNISYRFKRY